MKGIGIPMGEVMRVWWIRKCSEYMFCYYRMWVSTGLVFVWRQQMSVNSDDRTGTGCVEQKQGANATWPT